MIIPTNEAASTLMTVAAMKLKAPRVVLIGLGGMDCFSNFLFGCSSIRISSLDGRIFLNNLNPMIIGKAINGDAKTKRATRTRNS